MTDYSSGRIVIALMLAGIAKESRGIYMTARKDAIAYATYKDAYAGNIGAELRAYKTRRNGLNIMRYRWQTVNGQDCGLPTSDNAKVLVFSAMRSRYFTTIHVMLSARHLFE